MDKWIVEPLKKVNGISFGMCRTEVRKILGTEFKEFKKSKFSKNTTDDYGFCHVFYDATNKCEAIEIFDDITVSISGKDVFPTTTTVLKEVADDFVEEDDSFISKSKSIGVYAPNGKMESILLGNKDYYL